MEDCSVSAVADPASPSFSSVKINLGRLFCFYFDGLLTVQKGGVEGGHSSGYRACCFRSYPPGVPSRPRVPALFCPYSLVLHLS